MPDLIPCVIESPYAARKDYLENFAAANKAYQSSRGQPHLTAAYNTARMQVIDSMSKNRRYLRVLARHAIKIGFAPYASHGMIPHWLSDDNEHERSLGIEIGLIWGKFARHVLVGVDLGISPGMQLGIARHREEGRQIFEVCLGPSWDSWDKDAMVSFEP
jgi:hypothetical protein